MTDKATNTGFWSKLSRFQKRWTLIITCIVLLGTSIEYTSNFFTRLATGMMNTRELIDAAGHFKDHVKDMKQEFAAYDKLRAKDSTRAVMMFKAVMDTIREKEKGAKRFAKVSTEIDIGEMVKVPHNRYIVWATNHQVDPVTKQVHIGWFIHNGEPYKAVFNASLLDYFVEIDGKDYNCKDL